MSLIPELSTEKSATQERMGTKRQQHPLQKGWPKEISSVSLGVTQAGGVMAKGPVKSGNTSRIRFIMLEAEIPEGDLNQITLAIQNALKPSATVVQQRTPSALTSTVLANGQHEAEMDIDGEAAGSEEEVSADLTPPRAPREPKVRKPISMKVLDLDLTSEPSFEVFANNHASKNDTERNLVVLAWFKEHRSGEIVTANHVYTCYRAMKWPSGIDDFGSILRSLKQQQLVKSTGRGQYEINHLGIARVERMGSGA